MSLVSRRTLIPISLTIIAACVLTVGVFAFVNQSSKTAEGNWTPPDGIDSDRCMSYLEQICEIGPRVSGTEGMKKQQSLLKEFFTQQGATVETQPFRARHPLNGQAVQMENLIVKWWPERKQRVIICAHYDTRPFPDSDPVNKRGLFVGANDGASGVALMQELSHSMPTLQTDVGVDFVLFDGEELVYDNRRDPYFLGSEYFSKLYVSQRQDFNYRAAILVDMIADKELHLYKERNSLRYARPLVQQVWGIAKDLGITEFRKLDRYEVLDDHLALNQIAKIPAIDIIDFYYPRPGRREPNYWHTTQDIPANCSGESIAKVTTVVRAWLESLAN